MSIFLHTRVLREAVGGLMSDLTSYLSHGAPIRGLSLGGPQRAVLEWHSHKMKGYIIGNALWSEMSRNKMFDQEGLKKKKISQIFA